MHLEYGRYTVLAGLVVGFLGVGACSSQSSGKGSTQSATSGALGAACLSDRDCTTDRLICDASRNICVDCTTTDDCLSGHVCVDSVCVSTSSCKTSADCRSSKGKPICGNGSCVECASDVDCGDGDQHCVGNACRLSCNVDDDCPITHYCSNSACMPTVCYGNQTAYCLHDQLLLCNDRGVGFAAQTCSDGCSTSGGGPHCVNGTVSGGDTNGSGGSTGSTGSGGTTDQGSGGATSGGAGSTGSGNGPAASCPGGTTTTDGALCNAIPQFGGTQVVDGSGDEFCSIPGAKLNLDNAGFKSPATVQDSATSATIRLAWSTEALHAHVHVTTGSTGTLVQGSANLYDGDNVQFFISGVKPDGGGSGTFQIFVGPPAGGAAGRTSLASGSAAYDWATRTVSDGYEVELRWPWSSSGVSVSAGQAIGLYVLVGVSGTSGREVEYGFALQSSSSASCSSQGQSPQPWCDSTLWCAPTLQSP